MRLVGAYIDCRDGKFDLEATTIGHDLHLCKCLIDGTIYLLGSKCKTISLNGSSIKSLYADQLQADGGVFLRDEFEASDDVRLLGAKIGGDLDCANGKFKGKEISLFCDRIEIKGSVFLRNGFEAIGEVKFAGANIGGNLECDNSSFKGNETALHCDGIDIKGDIFLRDKFEAVGKVRLLGAKISGDLDCDNGHFQNDISAHNITVGGNLWLNDNFQIHGTLHFPNATIGGNVNCDGATFHNKNQCLNASRSTINGDVVLGKIKSAGTVSFLGSKIAGDFSAANGVLLGAKALNLRGVKIDGVFHWHPKFVNGEVNLAGAHVNVINMGEEQWMRKRPDYALKYDDILAENFPDLAPKTEPANGTENTEPEAEEVIEKKTSTEFATKIDNFTYNGFTDPPKSSNSNFWIEWLEQMPLDQLTKDFRPKPWGQLAGVLQSMGYEAEAKSVRIGKEKHLTDFMSEHEPSKKNVIQYTWHLLQIFWRRTTGVLVDYGYSPGKAVFILAMLMMVGSAVYSGAARKGIITPTHPLIFKEAINGFIPKECAENWVYFPDDIKAQCESAVPSEYSEFHSLIYSADVLLPIVNLRMESDWSPRVVNTDGSPNILGQWVRRFEWFLIIAGWILSLLFASAVGGIIRR